MILIRFATACIFLFLAYEATACSPPRLPPGVTGRSASPQEILELVPHAALGSASFDSDEELKVRGFRFTVERWIKGSGPVVIYVRDGLYSRHSKLPASSCDKEIPLNTPIVLLLKYIEPDGNALVTQRVFYFKELQIYVPPIIAPSAFGL